MKKFTILAYFIAFAIAAHAQSDSTRLATIAAKLEKQTTTHPIEKVYLHFNKPGYLAGDTIWFKAYVTAGVLHQPSALSGILYVDLIDDQDKVIKSLRLKIENATATGDIAIGDKQATGSYRIRAYTNWMRNAGPDYFFNKTISIGSFKDNAVLVSSYFDVSGTNHEGPANAKLAYTDKQGKAYDHKPVSYEIKAGAKTIYEGTGITDDKGMLTFAFSGKAAGQKQVEIISHIQLLPGITADKTIPISLQNESADVQFFPEGGHLINGVRSKVAFKAIGINGLSVSIKGIVLDNDHKEVAEFTTQHAGMGIFALTPEAGKTYMAKVTLPDSSVTIVNLPQAADKGFVLSVNSSDSANLSVRIATNPLTQQEKQGQPFYLVGQSNGKVYYTTLGKLDDASFTAVISKNKFPTGIVQFTLFSANLEPLNERVAFIQNPDQLDLALSTDKQTYTAKEKVTLTFLAKDAATKPAAGSFSVSVFNEDQLSDNENAESSIVYDILLTSDLKGYIEEPGYYFNQPNPQTKADLDVLMLTQGYRRFDWKAVMADQYQPISYQPEKSSGVSGKLTTLSGKPVANGKVSLLSVKDKVSIDTISDAEGRFNFPGIEFPDTTQLVIQAKKADGDKYVNILIDQQAAPAVVHSFQPAGQTLSPALFTIGKNEKVDTAGLAAVFKAHAEMEEANKKSAFNFNKNNKLKEVNIKERKSSFNINGNAPWVPVVTRSANLNGPGHANMVLTSEDVKDCIFPADCLIGKIPGLSAKYNPFTGEIEYLYFFRHAAQSIKSTPKIVFIIDGMVTDLGGFNNLASSSILTIEVLESGSYLAIYGQNASFGALVVTTKIGNEGNEVDPTKSVPGITTTKFNGFAKARQFYTPKYAYAGAANITDTRSAAYWNPNVLTDDKGSLALDFYNSDIRGSYRAVVEGIDDDGNIGRYVYRYKVE